MYTRIVLQFDFVLLDSYVIQAIVHMDTTIFGSEPHGRLIRCGTTILRGLTTGRRWQGS